MLRLSSKSIALVAVFAALYYGLSWLPGIPIVGLGYLTIELEASFASVLGIVLGPYLGSFTALVGTVLAWTLPPSSGSPYGLPFIFAPVINALVAGLIYTRRWKEASVIFAAVIVAFLFTPPAQPLTEYSYLALVALFDKIFALVLIFPTVIIQREFSTKKTLPLLFFLLAFIGNQADSTLGSVVFATPVVYQGIFGIATLSEVRFLFMVSPFFYPAIRIIQAVIATLVAVPLVRALSATGLAIAEPLEAEKTEPKRK